MIGYLFALTLSAAGILAALLYLKCLDHAETKRELDTAQAQLREACQRRTYSYDELLKRHPNG